MKFRVSALLFCSAMMGFQPAMAEDCETAAQLTREAESLPLAARITAYQSARAHCPSDPKTHYREEEWIEDKGKKYFELLKEYFMSPAELGEYESKKTLDYLMGY